MKKIIILFMLFMFMSLSVAQKQGSYAGGFLRMGTSARAVAMGSSFTAEIDKGFAT